MLHWENHNTKKTHVEIQFDDGLGVSVVVEWFHQGMRDASVAIRASIVKELLKVQWTCMLCKEKYMGSVELIANRVIDKLTKVEDCTVAGTGCGVCPHLRFPSQCGLVRRVTSNLNETPEWCPLINT